MLATLLVAALLDQDPVRTATPVLDRVTVYDGQALIERLVATSADLAGPVTLIVGPFPLSANPDSFQTVVESGDVVVMGLETRTRAGEPLAEGERERLRAALDEKKRALRDLDAEFASISAGKEAVHSVLAGVAAGRGGVEGVASADQTIEYVRTKMRELDAEQARCERTATELNAAIADLEQQLAGGARLAAARYLELHLALHFQRPGDGVVRVSYLAQGARWDPTYDVRVAPDLTGVKVGFVAQVTQSTGEDWSEAEVLLSTSTPSIGLDPPTPPVQTVGLGWDRGLAALGYAGDAAPAAPAAAEREAFKAAPQPEFRDRGLSQQFVLPGRKSVPSNGEAHRFLLREVPLEVRPYRYLVPSRSDRAFLRADVKLTGTVPLLAGQARIFLGPDYLGQASFPLLKPGDGTTLNLGMDPNLTVEWETLEDRRDNPGTFSISNTATITRVYRANLRLSAAARGPIEVIIEESIPLSNDNRIEVKAVQLQPAPLDTESDRALRSERGLYRWRLNLAPGATQSVRWGYTLSFDEDLTPIVGQR
jgi:uncharacterized protein (TIGR02231 family)